MTIDIIICTHNNTILPPLSIYSLGGATRPSPVWPVNVQSPRQSMGLSRSDIRWPAPNHICHNSTNGYDLSVCTPPSPQAPETPPNVDISQRITTFDYIIMVISINIIIYIDTKVCIYCMYVRYNTISHTSTRFLFAFLCHVEEGDETSGRVRPERVARRIKYAQIFANTACAIIKRFH